MSLTISVCVPVAPSGAMIPLVPVDQKSIAHAFTTERAVVAYCVDDTWRIRTDQDADSADSPAGEAVLYPCPEALALEVDASGDYLPVVRYQAQTYLLERAPAAK